MSFAPPSGSVGTRAPALAGQGLNGKPLAFNLDGERTVLVFWASWCGPCRQEQPGLNRIAADLEPKGIRLIGVDMLDHDRGSASAFLQEFAVAYPNLFDDAGKLAARYEVDAPPAIVLVDARGIIVGRVPGEISEVQLRELISAKLP